MTEYVQLIAVDKEGSHEEVVHAVAAASVWAYISRREEDLSVWDEWLSGPFVKSVRRGSNTQYAQAVESNRIKEVQFGLARAVASVPVPNDDLPLPWRKMQVSGLERDRKGWAPHVAGPTLYVNPNLEMSTGKTAAQVAHGLFAWFRGLDEDQVTNWSLLGFQFNVTDDPAEWIYANTFDHSVRINDAGRTEIEPGSLTVIGR